MIHALAITAPQAAELVSSAVRRVRYRGAARRYGFRCAQGYLLSGRAPGPLGWSPGLSVVLLNVSSGRAISRLRFRQKRPAPTWSSDTVSSIGRVLKELLV